MSPDPIRRIATAAWESVQLVLVVTFLAVGVLAGAIAVGILLGFVALGFEIVRGP